jgi:hypothetical protein
MMAAGISEAAGELHVDVPKRLFETRVKIAAIGWPYDVAPDGRFLINLESEATAPAPIRLVVNWQSLVGPIDSSIQVG